MLGKSLSENRELGIKRGEGDLEAGGSETEIRARGKEKGNEKEHGKGEACQGPVKERREGTNDEPFASPFDGE